MKKEPFILLIGLLLAAAAAQAYTNLAGAYAAMGFNPQAPGNTVVVLFSDPHINLDLNDPPSRDLDARLVESVNAMVPPPAKILVAGDITDGYSGAPGQTSSCCWQRTLDANETLCWLSAIRAFTNIAQTNIL
jgi:hypothetical protein